MSDEGKGAHTRIWDQRTNQGRVVYRRKKHEMGLPDAQRIVSSWISQNPPTAVARGIPLDPPVIGVRDPQNPEWRAMLAAVDISAQLAVWLAELVLEIPAGAVRRAIRSFIGGATTDEEPTTP